MTNSLPLPPSLRLALGLGDQELEQRLRPTLEAAEDLDIVAHCLAADHLLQVAQSQQVDAVLVAWSLHRLSDALLDQLERPGLIVALLVPQPQDVRWARRSGPVLSVACDVAAIQQAILAARPGVRPVVRARAALDPVALKAADRAERPAGGVICIAGGFGSPGRTTVAINLATALATAGPTVLLEADLCAPAIAAYLDRDPSRNVCTLAHAVRDDPRAWSLALADELQPLGSMPNPPAVLCGPPKREMRASVLPGLMDTLIGELAQRYSWVIVDVGPELLGFEAAAANHRAALARADVLVLVSGSDLLGLWHARTALDQLEQLLGIQRRSVQLVLNAHDARFHHSRQEVEWHLGAPVVAVIPFDHVALQRAHSQQRPVVFDTSSRAARALIGLAEGIHAGKLHVPSPSSSSKRAWWRRIFARQAQPRPTRVARVEAPRVAVLHERRSRAW
jgi:MinD-like ATPase involved in chromosome partitioning or flagellar assembly